MAALAPLMILGSTALGAVGMVQQSNAEGAAAEGNARQLDARAKGEMADASLKAEQHRKDADRLISKQRAIAAASGGGTGGSAGEIMAETAGQAEYNSALDLWLGGERATTSKYAADISRMEAKAKRKALPFQIGSAVLSGVSRAYAPSPFGAREDAGSSYTYG